MSKTKKITDVKSGKEVISPLDTLVMPKFTFLQAPLNRYTFSVKSIREWVEAVAGGRVLNLFAGKTKLNLREIRVDVRADMVAHVNMDALEFCKQWTGDNFDTIILDPPYSYRKSMEMYDGAKSSQFNQLKNEITKILANDGRVITFGYHSVSMGKKRGFNIEEILLISHGGAIHDTIVTVERKFSA